MGDDVILQRNISNLVGCLAVTRCYSTTVVVEPKLEGQPVAQLRLVKRPVLSISKSRGMAKRFPKALAIEASG